MFASTGNIRKFSVKERENPAFSVFLREILPGFNVCLMEIPGNMRYNMNEIAKEGIIMSEENNTPEKTHDAELPDGSYFEYKARQEAAERERKRRNVPYPLWVTIAYLILGFMFHMWHPGWIIFLTIPLFYLKEADRTPVRLLGNPVMVTIIYLLLGTVCNLWHPGWLVFLLIPLLAGK